MARERPRELGNKPYVLSMQEKRAPLNSLASSREVDAQGTPAPPPEVESLDSSPFTPRATALPSQPSAPEVTRETLRVDVSRVDDLVEMVGELVIIESMISNDAALLALRSPTLSNNLRQMAKIAYDLQTIALKLRMVPVDALFTRSAGMGRALARKYGKPIRMLREGTRTEMDRSMVERLSEPMMHMIRNALDHGIESPEERSRLGKAAEGCISLRAYHESGNLVIEIVDDGRGLDPARILSHAIARGLIGADDDLGETEIIDLIFAPGFTTTQTVADMSDPIVGMDVVRKSIKSMRGRIYVESTLGRGTCFKLVLPLTLAIIDGTLVSCGQETCILPTLSIIESIRPTPEMLHGPAGSASTLHLRGRNLPLFRLGALLDIPDAREDIEDCHAVIIESAEHCFALIIDDLLSQQQIVIKPIEKHIHCPVFAGAAILSDGDIGLIINVEEVVSAARLVSDPGTGPRGSLSER